MSAVLSFICVWLLAHIASSFDAQVVLHCDDEFKAFVRYDSHSNRLNNEVASGRNWRTAHKFAVSDVTPSTVLEIDCHNNAGPGGLIATIYYNGVAYSTTNPIQKGNFEVVSSADNDRNLKYSAKASKPWSIKSYEIDNTAHWLWNGNEHNTMTFRFDFGKVYQREEGRKTEESTCNADGEGVKALKDELERLRKNEAKLFDIIHQMQTQKK